MYAAVLQQLDDEVGTNSGGIRVRGIDMCSQLALVLIDI